MKKPLEARNAGSIPAESRMKESSTIMGAISAANELQNIGIIQAYSKIGMVRMWPTILR